MNKTYDTEELYNRYRSGEKVKDISIQTGLSTSCVYKRFQRFRKTQQQMITEIDTHDDNDAEKIESTEQTIMQSENLDWEEDFMETVLSFGIILLSVFLYRKYDVEIRIELKKYFKNSNKLK